MFPLLALTALASAFAGYQYKKNKDKKSNSSASNSTTTNSTNTDETSTAKNINTYNYYTNESENGNTLFGSQKKTKRTLFGGETV